MSLTVQGAQLLRDVREHISARPDTFDWSQWCGTRACIAGHVLQISGQLEHVGKAGSYFELAVKALGMDEDDVSLDLLFYGWGVKSNIKNPVAASAAINDFLWQHGYPSEPFTAALNEPHELPEALDAVRQPSNRTVLAGRV